MIKKFLFVVFSLLISISPVCLRNRTTPSIAYASDLPYAYVYLESETNIISSPAYVNKQAGIFFRKITPDIFLGIRCNDGSEYVINPSNPRYELTMANNLEYSIIISDTSFKLPMIFFTLTYDLERPCIYAVTDERQINNGEIVIRENVKVVAADNIGAQLYVSQNGCSAELCKNGTYTVNERGNYLFYSIDKANNRSDNFTVTYYEEEPAKEPGNTEKPDDTQEPSEPSKPSRPTKPITPDDSDSTVVEEETKTVKPMIIIAVVVGAVIIGVIVFIIVYKRAKDNANAAQFDDDE